VGKTHVREEHQFIQLHFLPKFLLPFSVEASQSTKMHQHCPQREQQKETADRSCLKPDNQMKHASFMLRFSDRIEI
jgi:hypothetical protein